MSKIPFTFTPIPEYFFTSGLLPFDNEAKFTKMMRFLHWSFKKCSPISRRVLFGGKMIELGPYEFIYGRSKSAKECGLTVEELRHQLKRFYTYNYLSKTPSFTPSCFTVYRWLTDNFTNINPQLNPQQNPQLNPHNQYDKKIRLKKDHQPYPSSLPSPEVDDPGLADDFSSKSGKERIEIVPGLFLTQKMLQACIAVKGNFESVQFAIGNILASPLRKTNITNWPNALAKWKIRHDVTPLLIRHEDMALRLERDFEYFTNGWSCRVFHDKKKDQKGLLFVPESPYLDTFFIPFIDLLFIKKASDFIRSKKMQKGRVIKFKEI